MTERLRLSEHNRRWWTLGAMCFALFMIMLDNTAVNVALPSIQEDFDASLSALEWTVNAYTLTFAVLLITGGRLGDIFGRRRMFLFGVVVFALSSATIGFAPSDGWLVASRAVQGIGAAFMMPATLSIISNAFPPEERGKAIGTWAGVSAIALAVGPLLGGWLTEDVSWRAIFFINLPVAVGAVAVTLFATHESRDETVDRRVDIPGIAAMTVALTALVFALVEGNSWGWGSAGIIGLLALTVVALGAFVAIERRAPAPIVDFDALRSKQFLGANIVAFMVSFGMLAMFFFLALYMQNILGFSPLEAGVRFLPTTLMIVVVAPIAGRLTDRIGPRWLITIGLVLVAVALYELTLIDTGTTYGDLLPAFVVMGIGIAMTMSPMSTAAMNAVSRDKAGIASGLLAMMRMVGGTLGVAATGAIFQAAVGSRLGGLEPGQAGAASEAAARAFIDGLTDSMRLSAAVALAGAVLAAVLIRGRREPVESDVAAPPEVAAAEHPAA
jgi:EmrB/QacA subfamily drug resistance transporter